MVDIYLEYEGDLHGRAEHGPSLAVLTTDAPVDNQGRGESFSPTDPGRDWPGRLHGHP